MSDTPKFCPIIAAGVKASGKLVSQSIEVECREQHCAWWVNAWREDGDGTPRRYSGCAIAMQTDRQDL